MEFGIFNLMRTHEADKPAALVCNDVAVQTRLAEMPYPNDLSLKTICDNRLIGDVKTVARHTVARALAIRPNWLYDAEGLFRP